MYDLAPAILPALLMLWPSITTEFPRNGQTLTEIPRKSLQLRHSDKSSSWFFRPVREGQQVAYP